MMMMMMMYYYCHTYYFSEIYFVLVQIEKPGDCIFDCLKMQKKKKKKNFDDVGYILMVNDEVDEHSHGYSIYFDDTLVDDEDY